MNNLNYVLLISTNLPYFINILYNKVFIVISIISTLHHLAPLLFVSNEKLSLFLLKLDIFMSLNIFIYILIINDINTLIKYLYVPIIFLAGEYNINKKNYNNYTLCHCIWHIMSADAIYNLLK